MRLPIKLGNQYRVPPGVSFYFLCHNILNFKEFSFFHQNYGNLAFCLLYLLLKNTSCLLVLAQILDEGWTGIVIPIQEKGYGSFIKTHFSSGR
jgi:hypothetical protein